MLKPEIYEALGGSPAFLSLPTREEYLARPHHLPPDRLERA